MVRYVEVHIKVGDLKSENELVQWSVTVKSEMKPKEGKKEGSLF